MNYHDIPIQVIAMPIILTTRKKKQSGKISTFFKINLRYHECCEFSGILFFDDLKNVYFDLNKLKDSFSAYYPN